MKIILAILICCCKTQNRIQNPTSAPRCYRCNEYTMRHGQDFIKREKNDDGCDRLISTTEIVEPRINRAFGNYKAQTVCFYAHSTGTMRLMKQKWACFIHFYVNFLYKRAESNHVCREKCSTILSRMDSVAWRRSFCRSKNVAWNGINLYKFWQYRKFDS